MMTLAYLYTSFDGINGKISAWFLTKWAPTYAYTVIFAGGLLGLSWALQIFISLYQTWFLRCRVEVTSEE